MKSCKVFAGNEELTAATKGETATSVTGSNDFTASNCSFGYNEGNAACVVMATSSVYPSGLAFAAISVASTPDAAGRLSTTTGWPNRSESLGVMSRATRSEPPPGAKGTSIRTGLVGYADAAPIATSAMPAANPRKEKKNANLRNVTWPFLLQTPGNFHAITANPPR